MQIRKDTNIRQKEIVLAARKLIVKFGSEHVTVRKIAEEIGVTEGAIYKHFKSKRDILSLLIDDIEEILITDFDNSEINEVNSPVILKNILLSHISAIEQRKGLAFQVFAEIISFGDKELNKKAYDVILEYTRHVQMIIEAGLKAGIIKSDINAEAAARLYFSMIQGLVNIWALSQYKLNLIEEYQSILKIFLEAIETKKNTPVSDPGQFEVE
jgi:AcrR family transcriptional regulator